MDQQLLETFKGILRCTYGGDKQQRDLVMRQYLEIHEKSPDMLINLLCAVSISDDSDLRLVSIAFLKREIGRKNSNFWTILMPETKEYLKSHIILLLKHDRTQTTLKVSADLAGEFAVYCVLGNEDTWPGLFDTLFEHSRSESELHRQMALRIWSFLIRKMPTQVEPYFEAVKQFIVTSLQDSSSNIRLAALKCVPSMLRKASMRNSAKPMLSSMIGLLLDGLKFNLSDTLKIMKILLKCAEHYEIFMDSVEHISNIFINLSLKVEDQKCRSMSLDFLIRLVQNRPKKMIKQPDFLKNLTNVLMQLMSNTDRWVRIDEEDVEDVDQLGGALQMSDIHQSLDDLSNIVGSKLLEHLMPIVQEFMGSQEVSKRVAALDALMIVAGGCKKGISKDLDAIIEAILAQLNFGDPKVTVAVVYAIAEYSTVFNVKLKHHDIFYQVVIAAARDTSNIQVLISGVLSIDLLVDCFSFEVTLKHLPDVLKLLYDFLSPNTDNLILKPILKAIGVTACKVGPYFVQYYEIFFDAVCACIDRLSDSSEHYAICAKNQAIETASLIAFAVGKEVFSRNVESFMNRICCIKWDGSDESNREVLMCAIDRVAYCMGADFIPYLPTLIPPLLEAVKMDMSHFAGINQSLARSKRLVLQQKCDSLELLFHLFTTLNELLLPYLADHIEYFLSLLNFEFSEGIRETSFKFVSHLSNILQMSCEGDWRIPVYRILNECLNSLAAEESWQVMATGCQACINIIYQWKDGDLDAQVVRNIVQLVPVFLEKLRKSLGVKKPRDRPWETFNKEKHSAIDRFTCMLGVLAEKHTSNYVQSISEHLVKLELLLHSELSILLQFSIGIFSSLCEYVPVFLQHINIENLLAKTIDNVCSHSAHLRSCCSNLLNKCAQNQPEHLKPYLQPTVKSLVALLSERRSNYSEESNMAVENAVCALTKILCSYEELSLASSLHLPLLLKHLPIDTEGIYANICHFEICILVERNFEFFFNNPQHLKRLFTFFSWCFSEEAATPAIDRNILFKIRDIINYLHTVNQDMLNHCTSSMDATVINCLATGIKNLS